jgi:hypothetical protein
VPFASSLQAGYAAFMQRRQEGYLYRANSSWHVRDVTAASGVGIASSFVIGLSLFGVMVSGQLTLVSGYPPEVALSVHNLAAFVCGFVSVQVDWLGAHRTGKLLFPRSVGSIHGSLPPFEGENFIISVRHRTVLCRINNTPLCGVAQVYPVWQSRQRRIV